MNKAYYKYEGSPLSNVWLANGFTREKTPYGEAVSIEDLEGLHRALGKSIAFSKGSLAAEEVKFLRLELRISQKRLADLLNVSEQSVARWEKGEAQKVSGPASTLLKALYLEHLQMNRAVSAIIDRMREADHRDRKHRYLMEDGKRGWQRATK